jgi:hypothetical protein
MNKICKKCNEEKELDMFAYHPAMADNRLSTCKECRSNYYKKKYDEVYKKRHLDGTYKNWKDYKKPKKHEEEQLKPKMVRPPAIYSNKKHDL